MHVCVRALRVLGGGGGRVEWMASASPSATRYRLMFFFPHIFFFFSFFLSFLLLPLKPSVCVGRAAKNECKGLEGRGVYDVCVCGGGDGSDISALALSLSLSLSLSCRTDRGGVC